MHPNEALVRRFYDCFQARDGAGMGTCYGPSLRFSDPVFPDLDAAGARAMWKMLCDRGKDLQVELVSVAVNDRAGHARWQAWYTFSGTGRAVHNQIESRFGFDGGAIVEHRDTFPLWKWAGQALGLKGQLLGWTPMVQSAIRGQAAAALEAWRAKHPGD